MTIRLVRRKGHVRKSPLGKAVYVRPSWVCLEVGDDKRKQRYRHACPDCGAAILSIHMPNRGWVHYFAEKGLTKVKHPCLHLGEGMSRARDKLTPDLFG